MLHCNQSTPTSAVWNLSGMAFAEITGIVAERVSPRVAEARQRRGDGIRRAELVSKQRAECRAAGGRAQAVATASQAGRRTDLNGSHRSTCPRSTWPGPAAPV